MREKDTNRGFGKINWTTRLAVAAMLVLVAAAPVRAASLALTWDPSTLRTDESPLESISGYRVYYGTEPGVYTTVIEVDSESSATIENLVDGQTYYFAVTTVDQYGTESALSEELKWNSQDTDVDNLPDAWEESVFGGVDVTDGSAEANQDGEGGTDFEEYIAGTDPLDADSELTIELVVEDGQLMIVFPATKAEGPGYEGKRRMFVLERSTDGFQSWRALDGMPVEGQNQIAQVSVGPESELSGYRLKCWLE